MVKCVLVVEKEKFLRSLFETALKARKVEIHTVESLQNNIYLLADLSPALVILDLETINSTPELISEVISYKKQFPQTLLVATGSEEAKNSFPYPLDGFLSKPIVVTNLASRILDLID